MGSYNEFRDKCPNCGKLISVVSKVLNNLLEVLLPGAEVKNGDDKEFLAMQECSGCGFVPIIAIEQGRFAGFRSHFSPGVARLRERDEGVLEVIEGELT